MVILGTFSQLLPLFFIIFGSSGQDADDTCGKHTVWTFAVPYLLPDDIFIDTQKS